MPIVPGTSNDGMLVDAMATGTTALDAETSVFGQLT
jgi:hypothetical protein